ncbi:MAG: hypothetical protein IJH83_04450 [Coriobacteriales bacterium]|nr:hypothetical protein [Coriobacteriales bacterium]
MMAYTVETGCIKQISVFLENKAGTLNEMLGVISGAGVNLLALCIADTTDFGIVRLIVAGHDVDKTLAALRAAGLIARETSIICLRVSHEPGAFARVLDLLADAGISIEYAYSFCRSTLEDALLIVRPSNLDLSLEVLGSNDVPLVTQRMVDEF